MRVNDLVYLTGLVVKFKSKMNILLLILDTEDTESVDFIKEGSEAGGLYDGIATFSSHSSKVLSLKYTSSYSMTMVYHCFGPTLYISYTQS